MKRLAPVALVVMLATVVGALAGTRYLPFQDLPNHQLSLETARALDGGASSEHLVRATVTTFAYSLHPRLDRALAPLLSAETVMRLMVLVGALLPLALALLARRLGGHAAWTGLLAIPMTLAWPLQMGFVSYTVCLPVVILATVAALDAVDPTRSFRRRALATVATAAALAVAYTTHPIGLLLGLLFVGLVALFHLRAILVLAAAAVPAVALCALDLARDTFGNVPGFAYISWDHAVVPRRPFAIVLLHVFALGTDARALDDLLWRGVFFAALVALTLRGLVRPPPRGRFIALTVAILTVLALATPTKLMGAMFIAERLPALALAFAAIPAGWTAARVHPAIQLVAVAAVALAVVDGVRELRAGGARVAAIVGDTPPHSVEGRVRAVLVHCQDGVPVPARVPFHLWAYAVHPTRGAAPCLFATRRFSPVWFQTSIGDPEGGPREIDAPAAGRTCADTAAAAAREELVHGPVLLIGAPGLVRRVRLARPVRRLAPGMALVTSPDG